MKITNIKVIVTCPDRNFVTVKRLKTFGNISIADVTGAAAR